MPSISSLPTVSNKINLKACITILLSFFILFSCEKNDVNNDAMNQKENIMIKKEFPEIMAPVAEKRENLITQFGETRNDEYFWLKDDNWQELLKEPENLRKDIKDYIISENEYYDEMTSDLTDLRKKIYDEMRGRVKEKDDSLPLKDGDYEYFRRYLEGNDYPVYVRRNLSKDKEEIIFDAQKASEGADFFRVGDVAHSPNHQFIAVSTDEVGSEYFTIKVHDLFNNIEFKEEIKNTGGYVVWTPDSRGFYYVERDENQRPVKVWYHNIGFDSENDYLIYEEENSENFLSVSKSLSGSFVFISSGNHVTSEVKYIPSTNPVSTPKTVIERKNGVRYSVAHRGAYFYVLTNDDAVNFKIIKVPLPGSGLEEQEFLPHRENVNIDDVIFFNDFYVRVEYENGLSTIVVSDYDNRNYKVEMEDEAYEVSLVSGYEFATREFVFYYESPSKPYRAIQQNVTTREQKILKVQELPSGHNPTMYDVYRDFATSHDGKKIPVTILKLKSVKIDGTAPLLLYGYGSYGVKINPGFSSSVLSMVDRGVVYAIAHIRGGSTMGENWYLDGKLDKKINSFRDFNDVAHFLINSKFASPDKVCIYGGSAGGLLVGGAINLEPSLYKCVIAAVPFVDVLNTISDDTLPLTPPEWDEWGNPITDEKAYQYIKSYSPYDNIDTNDAYPSILATGGLADYRVTYWEPTKWIARLRDRAKGGPFLLKMNMEAGHSGSAARFKSMEERAHLYAFALKNLGVANATPIDHSKAIGYASEITDEEK